MTCLPRVREEGDGTGRGPRPADQGCGAGGGAGWGQGIDPLAQGAGRGAGAGRGGEGRGADLLALHPSPPVSGCGKSRSLQGAKQEAAAATLEVLLTSQVRVGGCSCKG